MANWGFLFLTHENRDIGKALPLQRFGEKADISNATVFLFSDAANYITGQVLVVDGGDSHTGLSKLRKYPDVVLNPLPKL